MLKHLLLVFSFSILFLSCNLFNKEEDTPIPIDPEVEFILNDSLVGTPQESILKYGNGAVTFERPVDMKMDLESIYINDLDDSNIGVLKRFNLNGEFMDSLENVTSFYLNNNFLYAFQDDSISRYNKDFSYVSTIYKDIPIYPGWNSDGDENGCISTNFDINPLSLYNYSDASIETIGIHKLGADKPLEFQAISLSLKIIKDNQSYYIFDFQTKRIQILNLDGTYNSELVYDGLTVVGNFGSSLNAISVNDNNFFLTSSGCTNCNNYEARVQMFKKSDLSYVGFIENNDFEKTFISATNDKLYIISLDPTPKIVMYDLL